MNGRYHNKDENYDKSGAHRRLVEDGADKRERIISSDLQAPYEGNFCNCTRVTE